MLNYTTDIQPLEAENTDAEIAALLKASGVTVRSINRAELVHLLNIRGMLRKIVSNNSDEKWAGSVLNMQDAILIGGTDEQKEGIRLWFSHITNVSNNIWDTTLVGFAAAFWQMYQVFADGEGMPSTADFQAIADLGGGWKFATVTAQDVTDARQAYVAAQAASSRREAALAEMKRLRETVAPAMIEAAKVAYQSADYSQDIDHAAAVKAAFDAVTS